MKDEEVAVEVAGCLVRVRRTVGDGFAAARPVAVERDGRVIAEWGSHED